MMRFDRTMRAWGTPEFEVVLKREVAQLDAGQLPLQQGLSTGNYVSDAPITLSVNRVDELENIIRVTVGVFYQGIIGGCSCTDDPTPVSEIHEYCEVQLDIDRATGIAGVALVRD